MFHGLSGRQEYSVLVSLVRAWEVRAWEKEVNVTIVIEFSFMCMS